MNEIFSTLRACVFLNFVSDTRILYDRNYFNKELHKVWEIVFIAILITKVFKHFENILLIFGFNIYLYAKHAIDFWC